MDKEISNLSSLSRFKLKDEHLVSGALVKGEISRAFKDFRCYDFSPDRGIISEIKSGTNPENLTYRFVAIKNGIFDRMAAGDQNFRSSLDSDIRLSARLVSGIMFIHSAIADETLSALHDRRFVLIREKPGSPTIYHISSDTTVISHVGTGPEWGEIPSIYLGLNIFDVLAGEQKRDEKIFFGAFKLLLMIEERAIETGFAHTEVFPPDVSVSLNLLVDEVIRSSAVEEAEAVPEKKPAAVLKFTEKKRADLLRMLDARIMQNNLDFDYNENLKALQSIEKLARRYKKDGDTESLREVVRLLVPASGHDLHEIRNRANILLERIFSPKEFNAPLARRFVNIKAGEKQTLEFTLPEEKSDYSLRIYRSSAGHFTCEDEIDSFDLDLIQEDARNIYRADFQSDVCGHFDFTVIRRKRKELEWVDVPGSSGRINVIPDLEGEIILEIFPDIHGHTGAYWKDNSGHPGLVYNEHGEVIRLGNFSDIEAHLEDLKRRYFITSIYLLGVQKRGQNREDWAPGATSPSPFSPMSLVEIEPSLGGEKDFVKLVRKAHSLDIKIIVDIVPHLNRKSGAVQDKFIVKCYNHSGELVDRASTDGRYGSWDDGRLHNYRMFETWEWLSDSVLTLIDKFEIDGVRFDSAHAVPIMMKRNNFPYHYNSKRTHEEMVEGRIVVNDREDDHFITTGYYDSACRDLIAVPFHYYFMLNIEKKLKEKGKNFFINIAECYWGHERFLARVGIVPYNSALYKICENIIHGRTDVREIYHIYDNHFPAVLPPGTELLGILGNHDERRAMNTFGQRGLRAAVALTMFMSNIILDYEGSADGEGWKVFLDNIYVNWNQFEYAAHRSVEGFYIEWYNFHRNNRGKGYLIWANNNMTAAAMKFPASPDGSIWIGIFNFSDSNQFVSLQFDNPVLPIRDDACFRVVDPLYSQITGGHSFYTGRELKCSRITTTVSFTERVKLLRLDIEDIESSYHDFLKDSFLRLCHISNVDHITSNFAFSEIVSRSYDFRSFSDFIINDLGTFLGDKTDLLKLGIKRSLYHICRNGFLNERAALEHVRLLTEHGNEFLRDVGNYISINNQTGAFVFLSAEAEPFSKSGGLANVVFELPRELVRQGEEVHVISGYYKHGDEKAVKKIQDAVKKYNVRYTGRNVSFRIRGEEYQVGVHYGKVDGVNYYLLDHYEFFDGLYWGITAEEKLRRRVAFARASIELILNFNLKPSFVFTNDAYTGIFNGIVRSDPYYISNPDLTFTKFLHVVHNGGWQYFDSFNFYENGKNLFELFNLPSWRANEFADPHHPERINCMATGIRFADKVVTVSPSYAMQIERASDGLEVLLHNVLGISNAIGSDFRKRIDRRFDESGFEEENYPRLLEAISRNDSLGEKINTRYPEIKEGMEKIKSLEDPVRRYILLRTMRKLMLQVQKNLAVDPDIMLLSMIHRISEQKGFQLLLEASEGIFKHLGCQIIIGGAVSSGDNRGGEIAHGLYLLGQYYPDRVSVTFGFQDVSIPLLATDFFCMPSMNEPGGISQLEAFACGCFVIARATGGLRDTVFPLRVKGDDVEGNGFLFTDFNTWAFYDAVERAYRFYSNSNDEVIYKARINAENSVSYWDKPARKYIEELYRFKEIIRPGEIRQ